MGSAVVVNHYGVTIHFARVVSRWLTHRGAGRRTERKTSVYVLFIFVTHVIRCPFQFAYRYRPEPVAVAARCYPEPSFETPLRCPFIRGCHRLPLPCERCREHVNFVNVVRSPGGVTKNAIFFTLNVLTSS
jgi:hypothetical protein